MALMLVSGNISERTRGCQKFRKRVVSGFFMPGSQALDPDVCQDCQSGRAGGRGGQGYAKTMRLCAPAEPAAADDGQISGTKKPALRRHELQQERKIVASAKADTHTLQFSAAIDSEERVNSEA